MRGNRILVAGPGGLEGVPDWLLREVELERLALGLASIGRDKEEVGDAEACLYLYTASRTVPLSESMANIYLYLATKLLQRRGQQVEEGIAVRQLSENEERKLRELKRELYRKRGGRIRDPFLDAFREVFRKEVKP